MEWESIATMVVSVVLILTIGGVVLLRPIAKRLSDLLEFYAQEKRGGIENDVHRMHDLLETMDARIQLIEERQDFTDRLLQAPKEGARGPDADKRS